MNIYYVFLRAVWIYFASKISLMSLMLHIRLGFSNCKHPHLYKKRSTFESCPHFCKDQNKYKCEFILLGVQVAMWQATNITVRVRTLLRPDGTDRQSGHARGINKEGDQPTRWAKPACQGHQTFIFGMLWD